VTGLVWQARDPGLVRARLDALEVGPVPIRIAEGKTDRLTLVGAGRSPASAEAPLVAIGWATVELDRAARELGGGFARAPDDELLGACASIRDGVVLLEPSTEGRLAATLARHGEGPAALYIRSPDHDLDAATERAVNSGARFSRTADGPFGRSVLLLGGPTAGPHVVLVGSATIAR